MNIKIENNPVLKNQDVELNHSLSIIKSINGGGKTIFVNEVRKCYKNAIFLNREFIFDFFTSRHINDYVGKFKKNNYTTVIYKYISEFYERLDCGESFVEEFNEFAQKLNLSISIDKNAINAGILRFINNSGSLFYERIQFDEISNSEKTAFILWIANKCVSDVLILDNIDCVFFDCNIFYGLLSDISDSIQIISTSNREIEILQKYQFEIENGIVNKSLTN